ncbi:hypothetical protein WAI453_003009 [Rhynchosporium graminicola]
MTILQNFESTFVEFYVTIIERTFPEDFESRLVQLKKNKSGKMWQSRSRMSSMPTAEVLASRIPEETEVDWGQHWLNITTATPIFFGK